MGSIFLTVSGKDLIHICIFTTCQFSTESSTVLEVLLIYRILFKTNRLISLIKIVLTKIVVVFVHLFKKISCKSIVSTLRTVSDYIQG